MITKEQLRELLLDDEDNNKGWYDEEKFRKKMKFVRNQFEMCGKYDIPIIKKQQIDLDKIKLLG